MFSTYYITGIPLLYASANVFTNLTTRTEMQRPSLTSHVMKANLHIGFLFETIFSEICNSYFRFKTLKKIH